MWKWPKPSVCAGSGLLDQSVKSDQNSAVDSGDVYLNGVELHMRPARWSLAGQDCLLFHTSSRMSPGLRSDFTGFVGKQSFSLTRRPGGG